jgi:hypothetical protein
VVHANSERLTSWDGAGLAGRTKNEYSVGVGRECWVSQRDQDGVEHRAEIVVADDADVKVAIATGFLILGKQPWSERARGPLMVEVRTQHTMTLEDLAAWAAKTGGAPKDVLLRRTVLALLEERQTVLRQRRERR